MTVWINTTKRLPEFDIPVLAFCDNGSRMFVCKRVKNPDPSRPEIPYYWEDENVLDHIDQLNEQEGTKRDYVLYLPESVSWWCELPVAPDDCEPCDSLDNCLF